MENVLEKRTRLQNELDNLDLASHFLQKVSSMAWERYATVKNELFLQRELIKLELAEIEKQLNRKAA